MQRAKEPLTPEICQFIVIRATPDPNAFDENSDPAVVTLFDLGVVSAIESAVFVQIVKKNIQPWKIDDADIASSPGATVQQAADSLGQYAG